MQVVSAFFFGGFRVSRQPAYLAYHPSLACPCRCQLPVLQPLASPASGSRPDALRLAGWPADEMGYDQTPWVFKGQALYQLSLVRVEEVSGGASASPKPTALWPCTTLPPPDAAAAIAPARSGPWKLANAPRKLTCPPVSPTHPTPES